MEVLNDILDYKNLKIYQDTDFFSFSLDSIILANYSTIRFRDKNIVDFCTGNCVVPIILSQRTKSNILGVEIQEKLCILANKSIKLNKLEDRVKIVNSDIKIFSQEHLNEFDLVLCNPPYFKNYDMSTKNISYEKMVARHEVLLNLNDLVACAKKVLKDNGTFSLVHRTDRLMEIFECFKKNNIEPKRVKFIYNNINSSSTLVLIEGQKVGKVGMIVDKPLIMYNLDGSMTEEYKRLQEVINNETK